MASCMLCEFYLNEKYKCTLFCQSFDVGLRTFPLGLHLIIEVSGYLSGTKHNTYFTSNFLNEPRIYCLQISESAYVFKDFSMYHFIPI